jgi:hypothetical protein
MVDVRLARPTGSAAVLALALALAGCHARDAGPAPVPPVPRPPVTAAFAAKPKALFRAIPDRGSPRLYAVDANGGVRPVEFLDGDGNPVAAATLEWGALSADWAWVLLRYGDGAAPLWGQALLRLSDGTLLPADGLSLYGAQVKGATLYALRADALGLVSTHELLRIDLPSMTAAPVNDPATDPVVSGVLVDHLGNVRARVSRSAGPSVATIFPAGGGQPVVDPQGDGLCQGGTGENAAVYGEDGHVYAMCRASFHDPEGSTSDATYLGTFAREVTFTATGTQGIDAAPVRETPCSGCVEEVLPTEYTWTDPAMRRLDDRSWLLLTTVGFFGTTSAPGGGITLAWTDLTLPRWISRVAGGHAYWEHWHWGSGGTISRIRLAAGASEETVVTSPSLSSWKVAGGLVLFTRGGGAPGTYAVAGPGLDPTPISSAELYIAEVMEL